jgi:hypothetical protein
VANEWDQGIYVSPAEDFEEADSINSVVTTRDGRTIEPTTATLAPILMGVAEQEERDFRVVTLHSHNGAVAFRRGNDRSERFGRRGELYVFW